MKKAGLVLAGVFFAVTVFTGVSFAADKFGYVDLSKIFSEYKKTKDYDKVLSGKEEVYTKEREKKVDEIKKLQDKQNLLNDKEKEAKKGEIDAKVKSLQDYDRENQTNLRKDQDERMKEILKDIEDAVKQYAAKQGYTMVFNDRVLVYQDKSLNITDKVIEILTNGYKTK